MNVEEAGRNMAQRQVAQDPVWPARKGNLIKTKRVIFECVLMGFTIFACLFVKKISTTVSACFYKILQVTLLRELVSAFY